MRVDSYESFVVSHSLSPRTGPSIAYSDAHSYVLVKLVDRDGRVGWGETYATPGTAATVAAVAGSIVGRDASLRSLLRDVRWAAGDLIGGGFASSAISIALEDLRARQLGISVATMLGGPVRDRVQVYAASGGYVEGRPPAETWFEELSRLTNEGFTAMKLRIGRDPIREEAPLLRRLRAEVPEGFELMADGNAAYTFKEAIRMGRVLEELGFRWYEEPMEQRSGYVGYDRLTQELDIEVAGGEALMTRTEARHLLERHAVDIVQPDPVISGGVSEALAIAELAHLYGIAATPHTSNSAIGISAALQVIACLAPRTRSPSTRDPLLEYGVDDSPWRTELLVEPLEISEGWIRIPDGPGLGVEIDDAHVRRVAVSAVSG